MIWRPRKDAAEFIWLAEKYLEIMEDRKDQTAGVWRVILDMAKHARKSRGAPRLTQRQRMQERMLIMRMRSRKTKLVEEGYRAEEAAQIAAEEAAQKVAKTRNLSVTTLLRRLQSSR